jgi:hypothetical protein
MTRRPPTPKGSCVPPGRSAWHAPPNARFEALEALPLKPPTPSEVSALREAVRKETASRAEAYRTPVTEETLRRHVG